MNRILVTLAALALGCATTAHVGPGPTPHKYGATGLSSAFEGKTVYQCTAGTVTQMVFARPRAFVGVLSRGGTILVRPRAQADGVGSPVCPSLVANAVADGWMLLGAGESASWGIEVSSLSRSDSTGTYGSVDQIAVLDACCVLQGDLVVSSH